MLAGDKQYYLLALLSLSYIFYLVTIVIHSAIVSMERAAALRDINQKVDQLDEANETLEKFATEDDLTGLLNRRVFQEQLAAAVDEARNSGGGFSLLICDLDHFKNINDVSGHAAGDRLLKEVARRFEKSVGNDDTVARIGGDEFAVIAKRPQTTKQTVEFIRRLMSEVNRPVELEGTTVEPGISIGVSVYPFDAQVPQALMSHADTALQIGKSTTRGQYWFFDHQMRSKLISDDVLETDLRSALSEGQFELFYQPKIDIRSGRLRGFESLLRWRHPNGDMVLPGAFFPVAEERGLMTHLSDFVVGRFMDDIGDWLQSGFDPGEVSINIHPVQIKDRHRMRNLAREVEKRAISAEKFVLEITEECVLGRGTDDVPETLRFLRDRGFKISLDDFGTGYASLTHLKNLPVDEIKLDRSFVSDLLNSKPDHAIVHAMIKLADSLGLSTVAEGIENREQHDLLRAMGCGVGQGYLYGRPMDVETATAFLRAANGSASAEPTCGTKVVALNRRAAASGKQIA